MNVYENVTRQFNKAAELMSVDTNERRSLGMPNNKIAVVISFQIDDSGVEMFTGS